MGRRKFMWGALSAVLLLTSCIKEPVAEPVKVSSGFFFDTYVTISDYSVITYADATMTVLKTLNDEFSAAYKTAGNKLKGSYLSDCAAKTAALNREYGGDINLTCGALTELWGISTDAPAVPEQSLIDKALGTVQPAESVAEGFEKLPDGTRLDFGAVAKGYACDSAYSLLSTGNNSCEILSMGSSTLLYGEKPDGSDFTAAIKNPDAPTEYIGIIRTKSAFISTSGGYERYFEAGGTKYEHIIDVSTGCPAETDLTSVTVIIPSDAPDGGIKSDFLATMIYIGGTEKLDGYLDSTDFCVIAADSSKNIYISKNSPLDFNVEASSGYKLYEE